MILLSVVIPTFNRAHVLPRSIDSVICQTYPNWELLIVDDGSEDGTEELVSSYVKKDVRIKYFQRPIDRLPGGNACRNVGAENSKGEYIAYLDSDDYWMESRLGECVKFIERKNPDCFYSGRTLYDYSKFIINKSRSIGVNEFSFDFLLSKDTMAATSSFVLKQMVSDYLEWNEDLLRNQDYDFFINVAEKFHWKYLENYDVVFVRKKGERKFMDIPSCLRVYNDHKSNIRNKDNANRYLREMMEYCSKYYQNIHFASSYFELLKQNGYSPTFRDKFQTKFPYLFYFLYRTKKFFFNTK